jgi:hypothetical protein
MVALILDVLGPAFPSRAEHFVLVHASWTYVDSLIGTMLAPDYTTWDVAGGPPFRIS